MITFHQLSTPIKIATKQAKLLVGASALAFVSQLTPVFAQDTGSSASEFVLEEVLVTARRRAENLQDVPMAIQAISAETLQSAGIRDLREITNRIPGVTFSLASAVDAEIFIRGIGTDIEGAAADSPIGIFVDGVYMSRNTGAFVDLFDLQRVEVLKGPQSLRFGKNTVGGLIHYVTKRPTDQLEASFEVKTGNYGSLDLAASATGPINDTTGFTISASSQKRDGFSQNTVGGDEEDIDAQSLRGSLVFNPSDKLSVRVAVDATKRDDGGRWINVTTPGDSSAVTYNGFFAPSIDGLPGFVLPNRNAPFMNSNPRRGARNLDGFTDVDLVGGSLTFEWDTGPGTLTSITALRDGELSSLQDDCGMYWNFPGNVNGVPQNNPNEENVFTYLNTVPDCFFAVGKTDNVSQFSQELRYSWNANDRTRWSVGAFYLTEEIDREETIGFSFPDFSAITNFAFYGPAGVSETQGVSNAFTSSDSDNLGIFGEVNFDINENLELNAGVRYAEDDKDLTVTRFGQTFDSPIEGGRFTVKDSNSWDAWLPEISLTYTTAANNTIYGRLARGYKPGGYTGEGAGNPADAIVSFDPEFSTSFEVGSKMVLSEGRARLNIAAHYTEYEDLQTQQFVQVEPTRPPDNFVVNATEGTVAYGIEADFEARLTESLKVFGNYAFTKCEFSGKLIVDDNGTDVDGNTCRRTPEHGINIGAEYTHAINSNLEGMIGFDYQWKDDYFFDNENSPILVNDSENVLNPRAGVSSDRWEVTAWVKNATDELNNVNLFEIFGTLYSNYSPPRTYGVTFRYDMK